MISSQATKMLSRQLGQRKLTSNISNAKRSMATGGLKESLLKYPIGQKIHGYEIQEAQEIPQFSLVAVRLRHSRTGSEHLHLDAPHDRNNVFSVAFKTNPPDKTGVPHILEHTTLCGSYKYPVRDPFFKMLNRSLSNFMNAMTGHDYTYYPFATTNAKDFENLMDVYLSSTFEPLLTFEDFTQEGWRVENSDIEDRTTPLAFKGVVYNEMKGQYSNSAYQHWIKFQEAIYPSLKNSGGDPSKMTSLNYEDLLNFHHKNYHPSNARTFTYGTFPLADHLKKLDSVYELFGSRQRVNDVKKPIFSSTYRNEELYVKGPTDSMSDKPMGQQYKSSVTWYLGNPLDETMQYEIFKWKVLSSLLFDGHNAPFYQDLIETEYGEDFSVNSGIDSTTALFSFSVGLNNITEEKVNELETKVVEILKEKVMPRFSSGDKKFDDRVKAILHQIELNFKKHKPEFGLSLLSSLVPTWVHGLNPIDLLQVETILSRFKNEYREKGLALFKESLERTILNPDTQRFKFTVVPDENYHNETELEEKDRLEKKVEKLDEKDRKLIYERGLKLAEKQKNEEDVSVLPTLTMNDIPRRGDFYDLEFSNLDNSQVQKRIVDTNGLVYVTSKKDISFLPEQYYKYLPLFMSCLTNLAGTSETSVVDLESKIQSLTGRFSFSASAKTDPFDISQAKLLFIMRGMALESNSKHIYDLWYEVLTDTKFDESEEVIDKLAILIKGMNQNQVNYIADRGHSFANALSNSKLTPAKYISNQLGGLDQVQLILDMNSNLETKSKSYLIEEVIPILKEIRNLLLHKGKFSYSLVGDKKSVSENENYIYKFDEKVNGSITDENHLSDLVERFKTLPKGSNTHVDLPYQVGYASLAKTGSNYTSKDGASLQILAQILTYKHLHSVIREANGAYGGGLNYDGLGGTLNFYSYRDPHPFVSVESFKASFDIALQKAASVTNGDLQDAKLSVFQSIDAPGQIASQGSSNFLEGITDEMRQERRESFLDTNSEDLKNVAEKYLIANKQNVITVIGNPEKLPQENSEDWNIRKMSVEALES